MKTFLGFAASLLPSLPWREGVRGRGTGPPPPALRCLRRDWPWKWTLDSMARRRLPGGTKNVPDGRRLGCGELKGKGYRVVRFWNNDIPGDLEGVLESIAEALRGDSGTPSPYPSPVKGEGEVNGDTNGWPTASFLLVLRALIHVENDIVGPFSSFAGDTTGDDRSLGE